MKTPLTYHGGKSKLAPVIVSHFPAHTTYVEPFGGSASVLLAKPASAVEVYNDVDGDLVNFFHVLRAPELATALEEAIAATPYSRAEFERALQPSTDPVERARRLMVRQRQSYGGRGERWAFARSASARVTRKWNAGLERLQDVHQRLRDVQIESCDWTVTLDRYDSPETLFYLDPPYHPETRVGGGYAHEMGCRDHERLVRRLLRVRGAVVLSGYAHAVYAPLERARGWERVDVSVMANGSDTRTRRTESLWLSRPRVQAQNPMQVGAAMTAAKKSDRTTRRVRNAIARLGGAPSITEVACALGLSREHLSRRYRHLFA